VVTDRQLGLLGEDIQQEFLPLGLLGPGEEVRLAAQKTGQGAQKLYE